MYSSKILPLILSATILPVSFANTNNTTSYTIANIPILIPCNAENGIAASPNGSIG